MAADEPPVLLPCSICGRTFKPQSLEKHTVICARSLAKKRKPFDSAKQRIRGTELEEFLPKLTKKKFYPEERRDTSTWKETHDEFIKTIRAARGDTFQQIEATVNRQTTTTAVPGPPTRANEKGLCPTCHRQFGIKAYDRHVAWCRDRITRAPASPATNMAKERLEARIKYRAPALKNRRLTNREKYAPSKKTVSPLSGTRIQENISLPHCNKLAENPSIKPSAIAERRSGQGKNDGVIAPGPLKSRLADRSTTGVCQDYDSFHRAERQLNELLSDTCSDKSFPDSPSSHKTTSSSPIYAQSHSSAFALYPKPLSLDKVAEKRASLIAPPSEFDDMSTGFSSSDSTETNLTSKEYFPQLEPHIRDDQANKNRNNQPVLGRRLIIDKSKALGVNNSSLDINLNVKNISTDRNNHKIAPKVGRTQLVRSNSVRATSAPKIPDRKDSLQSNKIISQSNPNSRLHSRATNSGNNISGSNLSLSSIVSSEVEIKLPNSLFDDFASSLDDDSNSFPSLRSFLKNDSLSISSPVQPSRQRNGQISDEDLSSPDSYKKQEQSKLSADSAYSSLNRKYSNEKAAKLEEEISGYRRGERENQINALAKLSKFCHECGTRFPLTAKFCCECGVQRLAL